MTRLVNINFYNGDVGPGADPSGGFYAVETTLGGIASFGPTNATTRSNFGSALGIVTDSSGYNSKGKTVLEGYDDRPLSDLTVLGISSENPSFSYSSWPTRVQHGDSWWYSFSLYLPGNKWAKAAPYEPRIWHMAPIQPGQYSGNPTYAFKSPVSLSIDFPGTPANAISSWYQFTTTPHLYVDTLLPGTYGTDAAYFNNMLNYQHGDLGQLSFNTWYDIKLFVNWRSSSRGQVQAWIKTASTKSFPSSATWGATAIQTIAKVGGVATEGYLRTGFTAYLNNSSSLANMTNTLYMDNILAGNTSSDVDLYPPDLDVPGTIVFDGGWDTAQNVGGVTNNLEIFSSSWNQAFAAPGGSVIPAGQDTLYSIQVESDSTYNSPYAGRFELHPGDKDGFFERTEVFGTVVPFAGGTGAFSWSTYFDDSWDLTSTVPTYFWRMVNNGHPQDPPMFGLYAANGSVYLQVTNYATTQQVLPVVPWGTAMDYFIGNWSNFKVTTALSTSPGSVAVWINNVQQTMNYPLGIGNGGGGINTVAYQGPTLKSGGSGIYPAMGVQRLPDNGTAILWHDNFKITS